MTVYVDDARNPFGGMIMSHMVADTEEELHQMASDVGLLRSWFQSKSFPHYDISQTVRKLAIRLGAVPISRFELVAFIRRNR